MLLFQKYVLWNTGVPQKFERPKKNLIKFEFNIFYQTLSYCYITNKGSCSF